MIISEVTFPLEKTLALSNTLDLNISSHSAVPDRSMERQWSSHCGRYREETMRSLSQIIKFRGDGVSCWQLTLKWFKRKSTFYYICSFSERWGLF